MPDHATGLAVTGDAAARQDAALPRRWLGDDSLATGMVLSACAGLLDAFSYLGHGQAFATFMTGNLVLLGIHLASGGALLIYLLPLCAYFAGVAIARAMGRHRAAIGRPAVVALALEAVVLLGLAIDPLHLRDRVLVSIITLVAAVQNTSFRQIGRRSYNSAFMTGNFQTFATLIADGLVPPDRAKLGESLGLGAVIASFFGGAVVAGVLTPRLHLLTLLVPAAALTLLALLIALPRRG